MCEMSGAPINASRTPFRFLLIVGMVWFTGCREGGLKYEATLHGTSVRVFQKANRKSLISVHADKTTVLQIGKQRFESVRGYGCRFIEIEELRTLVFVTEESDGTFVHAFDLANNVDVKAPLGDASGFGYWLGSSNQQHQAITMLTSNKLLLSITGPSYPERKKTRWDFLFDLERKSVRLFEKKELVE